MSERSPLDKMLLLLFVVLLLHITPIVLLIVATVDSSWWNMNDNSTDLWFFHQYLKNSWIRHDIPYKDADADWIQAVQGLMILSVVFCLSSFVAFICQLFTLHKGGRFYITGILQLLACICVLCAASIYVGYFQPMMDVGVPGYSYILAWVSFPLTLFSGSIYCFLRKKE
uniref:peripheral myelin protein 22-like n=1 Tax=Myxine glutinosa TaxID=7769 RepID=UPI0035901051